jgi:hypothetical protein
LFDKGVIRRVYERRVRLARGAPPTLSQVEAANVYAHLSTPSYALYITTQTEQVLRRRPTLFAAPLLMETRPLQKGRYLRRWARRLREFLFSPEDAIVLAYGSFGIDLNSTQVGVDTIVTNDFRLARHFQAHQAEIDHRFSEMRVQLPAPYATLTLPDVVTTTSILDRGL